MKTREQAIERLKTNLLPWMALSADDKEYIIAANYKGKIENLTFAGTWENNPTGFNLAEVGANEIFRICKDYQPEPEKPEDIDRKVYSHPDGDLVVDCPDGAERCIDSIVHHSDFRGFFLENGDEVSLGWVARRRAEGRNVMAKFEGK